MEAPPKFAACVKVPTKSPPSPWSPPVKVATDAKLSTSSYSFWLPKSPLIITFPTPALIVKFLATSDYLIEVSNIIFAPLEVIEMSDNNITSPM